MPKQLSRYFLLIINIFVVFTLSAQADVIHQEKSLYRNILVEDDGDLRCLKFNVKSTKSQQSCLYKSQPKKLVFNYTKLLMSGLLLNPEPKRILIVGLGGGTMSNTLAQLFPSSHIDNIEIDEAVISVARRYFGFSENDLVKTYNQDGRIFIKRALLKKQTYDWIILDAFNGDYIPEHLLTKEFLQETKRLLSENGILTANTFSLSELYAHESATYKAVFGDFYQVKSSVTSNRVILVSRNGFVSTAVQEQNIKQLDAKLQTYNVDIEQLYRNMYLTKDHQDWSDDTRLLTDQFSPANLLNL
ncbi:spermidine synthase [Colwellia psychrerythraea]|uniref:Polyamine aminopropyltransferase n=1 Tax=Colwellia psychrerythraea TaxID=28229 RepID=A0A1Y5E719_COLPS|nr:spermidine synthase [Colwellia psychrerythraea]